MFSKFSNSWELIKASAQVLKADKELLVFPLISAIALILVVATFVVPTVVLNPALLESLDGESTSPIAWVIALAFYFVQYSVILFFNSALVGAAMIRLDGGDPTVSDGLRIATSRIGTILGYALIAATVGVALRALRERSGILGNIAAGLFGLAWSLATYLIVPILVVRGGNPIEAIKESASVLKRTWGEQIVGNFGIGMVFLFVYLGIGLAGAAAIAAAGMAGMPPVAITLAIVTVLVFMLAALVQSALSGIYTAALYRYATAGEIGGGFPPRLLEQAFRAK